MSALKPNNTLKRELKVAFAKHAQPVWVRITKYVILLPCIYFFWNYTWFWIILTLFLMLSLVLHFWYRHKTAGWTKTYGKWDYEKNKSSIDPD